MERRGSKRSLPADLAAAAAVVVVAAAVAAAIAAAAEDDYEDKDDPDAAVVIAEHKMTFPRAKKFRGLCPARRTDDAISIPQARSDNCVCDILCRKGKSGYNRQRRYLWLIRM